MRVCIFEDDGVANLEPLTLTRPAFDLRCGSFPLWIQHRNFFGATDGAWVRRQMVETCELAHPNMLVNDSDWLVAEPTVLVNARWMPGRDSSGDTSKPHLAVVGDQIAYAVLTPNQLREVAIAGITRCATEWKKSLAQVDAGGWMMNYPWDLVECNPHALLWNLAGPSVDQKGIAVIGPDLVWVDETATIEPGVVADTTRGGVFIDRDAVVQAFSRLEGPCYIGPGAWIIGAKIRGSSIGPMCRVGGEVEATIMHGYSNKYHDGFLGHSYVGEWVNLAAGTQVSDLRNDYGNVTVTINGKRINTGLSKVGSFIGDHTKTGLGALFNTGTAIGAFCNLLPSGELMPRVIPSLCRYSHGRIDARSDWGDLLTTAERVMERRGQQFTDAYKNLINAVHEATKAQREQALR